MKTYIFIPKGHGQLSFATVANDEKEAFENVDKYIKENYTFGDNKIMYEAQGWNTDYYYIEEVKESQVLEIEI